MQDSDADEQHKRVEHNKLESMLGLAELGTCRRQALLAYFDDELPKPCGNCDNCLNPPSTWDATEAAQKALSCCYRTGQRFGVNYLVDVLLGKDAERIKTFGHDKQSTFGIGGDRNATQWRTLYRQLIAKGLLSVDVGGHGSVMLTEAARPILRGERTLELREIKHSSSTSTKKKRSNADQVAPADRPLWEKLRTLRTSLSDGKPAYLVFSDNTLVDMVEQRPTTLEQMSAVSGVGKHKLEKYGDEFTNLIREHDMFADMDDEVVQTEADYLD